MKSFREIPFEYCSCQTFLTKLWVYKLPRIITNVESSHAYMYVYHSDKWSKVSFKKCHNCYTSVQRMSSRKHLTKYQMTVLTITFSCLRVVDTVSDTLKVVIVRLRLFTSLSLSRPHEDSASRGETVLSFRYLIGSAARLKDDEIGSGENADEVDEVFMLCDSCWVTSWLTVICCMWASRSRQRCSALASLARKLRNSRSRDASASSCDR